MLIIHILLYFYKENDLATLINGFNTIIQMHSLLTSKMANFWLFTWLQIIIFAPHTKPLYYTIITYNLLVSCSQDTLY